MQSGISVKPAPDGRCQINAGGGDGSTENSKDVSVGLFRNRHITLPFSGDNFGRAERRDVILTGEQHLDGRDHDVE